VCAYSIARAIFAGQIDGATEITPARYDDFRKILAEEKPDIVLTHWPVDTLAGISLGLSFASLATILSDSYRTN